MLIKELYEYREMIRSLVVRDLRGRYKNSALGFFWTFLNPLCQLIVYTFVFSVLMPMEGIDNYYIHLFVALVPWIFFSTCLTGGSRAIVDQQDMVKKIYFPREVIPLAYTTSQFVNMLLTFIVIFAVVIFTGFGVNFKAVLCLPLVLIIHYILALGITFISSAVTVYLRDTEMILGVISLAWMYLSPIIYPISLVPERFMKIYNLNPLTPIIIAYRDILYYKKMPNLKTLLLAGVLGIVVLLIGVWTFKALKKRFVEEL